MKFAVTSESKKTILVFCCLLLLGSGMIFGAATTIRLIGILLVFVSVLCISVIVYFYRDPERSSSEHMNVIVAPADGRVIRLHKCHEDRIIKGEATRIAIFMHIGNVHIQRLPSDGTLLWTQHQPGSFRAILDSKASIENEQCWFAFENKGRLFAVVQIAGLFARRTLCWIESEKSYKRGDRLGMIALGSEVDLYLPPNADILIKEGQRVFAGETIIGRWR